ncbi:isochorismatase family cysteine hydrolase [Bradyrhizobium manausense]|uniref:isochorismatase family cysteine hydrolase n=1 Tax=Bradyrhizobium manausense TaxID=989370 RepID=UPI001BA9B479|nr:isochorismatase family cysteine hydrolase [Bradyrhizobium manausense]MBR0724203.1 cysteine hydrolase [Bradyrhizobium manausense]
MLLDLQLVCLENWVPETQVPTLIERTSKLLKTARAANLLVVHVKVGFRTNYPEISPRNKLFTWLKENQLFAPGSPSGQIHPALAPTDFEPVVVKHRVGAFTGTDLERILRANEIDTVIIAGISTSGAVLSAVRQAFDLDYRLVLAQDCCADLDAEVQKVVVEKIIAAHATIASAAQIVRAIQVG